MTLMKSAKMYCSLLICACNQYLKSITNKLKQGNSIAKGHFLNSNFRDRNLNKMSSWCTTRL